MNLGIYLRSFLTLHFVLSSFLFTIFGLANWIRFGLERLQTTLPEHGWFTLPGPADLPLGYVLQASIGPDVLSPWFMLVELMLLTMVIPLILAYWLASQDRPASYQPTALMVMFLVAGVMLVAGLFAMGHVSLFPLLAATTLVFAFIAVEWAWKCAKERLRGSGPETQEVRMTIPRAILTTWLGQTLFGALVAFAFALADTLGQHWFHATQSAHPAAGLAQLAAVLAALMPVLNVAASLLTRGTTASVSTTGLYNKLKSVILPWVIAVFALLIWATLLSFVSHWAFNDGKQMLIGVGATGFTFAVSVVLRWAIHLINRTSLQSVYAARLGQTYLGATNPARSDPTYGKNVTEDVPGDDLPLLRYAPHEFGGPIHIINATINQTTDVFSRRPTRDRPGEVVAVTKLGISVGRDSHVLWREPGVLTPIDKPLSQPHPFGRRDSQDTEDLSLKNWIAISGAAISAARGAATNIGATLLMGVANLRTGYWWRSGTTETNRPGPKRIFWVMSALDLIPRFFLPQFLLIYEFMGIYGGPWVPYWYLSDGGFFENLAVYELLRRRVRTIICCDAGQDGDYVFEDLGNLVRKARIDFHAEIKFLTAAEIAIDPKIPQDVKACLGEVKNLKPPPGEPFSAAHAALAVVRYDGNPNPASVLLYVKLSMTGDEPPDVMTYRALHLSFPHDSTGDQFFDEAQWESYRALGEDAITNLLKRGPGGKFWLQEYL